MPKNYYLILGVPPDATIERIRSAYRERVKRTHPDRRGPGGEPWFREIAEAYEVLCDPRRREQHDRELGRDVRNMPEPLSAAGGGRGSPLAEPISITGRPGAFRPSLDAFFEYLSWNFTGLGVPKGERVEPLDFELILSPEEAEQGARVPFEVPVFRVCPHCGGTGREWALPCEACGQEGRQIERRVVEVAVPARVRPGTVIEVSLRSLGVKNLWLRVHVRVGRH